VQSPLKNDVALPLHYDRPLAIVGGGTVDTAFLQELAERNIALVAADGGADAIGAAGLIPDAIIGDLDSLADRKDWERRTRVIHVGEQITTDFQKCLYSTEAPVTLALGMTGRRLDHTLAALSALLQVGMERKVLLVDEVDVALTVSGPVSFSAAAGERVSVHPFLPTRFEMSTGLLYPLDGLTLDPAGRLGTSNEAAGGTVAIVPAEMTPWLLILGRERIWDLVAVCLGEHRVTPSERGLARNEPSGAREG
jgi:thiamine pyrophosphokinase